MNSTLKFVWAGALALLVSACASIPQPLQGDPQAFTPLMANQVNPTHVGSRVRWGGVIVSTQPQVDRTCMEVLARALDRSLRPIVNNDLYFGRFMACGPGFRDPAIYTEGREVSMIGQLDGFIEAPVGEYLYRYPTVTVASLYLWPERQEAPDYPVGYPTYYHSWWGPYPYPVRRIYVPVRPKVKDKDD